MRLKDNIERKSCSEMGIQPMRSTPGQGKAQRVLLINSWIGCGNCLASLLFLKIKGNTPKAKASHREGPLS
jgi:hypothetical protein